MVAYVVNILISNSGEKFDPGSFTQTHFFFLSFGVGLLGYCIKRRPKGSYPTLLDNQGFDVVIATGR